VLSHLRLWRYTEMGLASLRWYGQPHRRERHDRQHPRSAPRRALDLETAVEGLDAIGETAEPRAGRRVGTADPVVSDLDRDGVAPICGSHRDARRAGVLGNVRQGLRDDVEDRHLDRAGETLVKVHV